VRSRVAGIYGHADGDVFTSGDCEPVAESHCQYHAYDGSDRVAGADQVFDSRSELDSVLMAVGHHGSSGGISGNRARISRIPATEL